MLVKKSTAFGLTFVLIWICLLQMDSTAFTLLDFPDSRAEIFRSDELEAANQEAGSILASLFTLDFNNQVDLLLIINFAESIDTATMRNGIRSCTVGQFIVGIDLDGNRLLCSNQPVVNSAAPYSASFEVVDTSTFRQGLKACPEGYGMTGLNVVQKKVSCAHIGKTTDVIFTRTKRSGTKRVSGGESYDWFQSRRRPGVLRSSY